jgi:hypothetical protein
MQRHADSVIVAGQSQRRVGGRVALVLIRKRNSNLVQIPHTEPQTNLLNFLNILRFSVTKSYGCSRTIGMPSPFLYFYE